MKTKNQRLNSDRYHQYKLSWRNYKSDKHKSKKILRSQISDLFTYGTFTKEELIEIKDAIEQRAFNLGKLGYNRHSYLP